GQSHQRRLGQVRAPHQQRGHRCPAQLAPSLSRRSNGTGRSLAGAMTEALSELLTYFSKGGFVMYPLALGTLVLWYCLGYRFLTLQRGSLRSVQKLIYRAIEGREKPHRGVIDRAVSICVQAAIKNKHSPVMREIF